MITGSCLCGTVRWQVDGDLGTMSHCHCSMCRKAHGAPFATYVSTASGNFRWLDGEETITTFESSPGFLRAFCSTCGSVVPDPADEEGHVFIPAGCLDGEPGVRRGRLESADSVIDNMLDMIFAEMPLGAEDSVAVLVNGLGSTTLMEQYVAFRRVHQRLTERGTRMHSRLIGSYCTSLEMGGLSVTLLQLDDELTRLIDHPADCVMFRQA